MADNNVRVFVDPLRDQEELRFIFEYGFQWDDHITKLIGKKSSQNYRELEKILAEEVYSGRNTLDYEEYIPQERRKRNTNRKLLRKKCYETDQVPWFQNIYECYCMNDLLSLDDEDFWANLQRMSGCKDCANCFGVYLQHTCSYQRICRAFSEKSCLEQISRREFCSYELANELMCMFPEVIIKKNATFSLIKNTWTYEEMQQIFSQEEYRYFIEGLDFLARFTPMSILGSNFLKRLHMKEVKSPFLVRGIYNEFGIEQEVIFRFLCARNENHMIEWKGNRYHPIKLFYTKNTMDVKNQELMIQVLDEQGKIITYPAKGNYFSVSRKKSTKIIPVIDIKAEPVFSFEVRYYYNDSEQYGEIVTYQDTRKNLSFWSDYQSLKPVTLQTRERLDSPYYPENRLWKVDIYHYTIRESDVQGFLRYLMSFGEFARWKTDYIEENEKRETKCIAEMNKSKWRAGYSLCNIYTSRWLIEKREVVTPPLEAEVAWIGFVLAKYPNVCRMFIKEECIQRIQEKIKDEYGDIVRKWFPQNTWDFEQRVLDIHSGIIEKMQGILDAIRDRRILCYEFNHKMSIILPYAIEYSYLNHMQYRKHIPFQVMCYSLMEKRNVLIDADKIMVKNYINWENHVFSTLDRIYYILEYAVCAAQQEIKELPDTYNEILNVILPSNTRSKKSNQYQRLIAKKYGKLKKTMAEFYAEGIEMLEGDKEALLFLENAFSYYCTNEDNPYFELLLSVFLTALAHMNQKENKEVVREYLAKISNEELYGLLTGTSEDNMDKEINKGTIPYYNEHMKLKRIVFKVNTPSVRNIDLVYDVFKSYVCAGIYNDDGTLSFTVTYESFNYRDVHKNILALRDIIGDIEPEAEQKILQERIDHAQKVK